MSALSLLDKQPKYRFVLQLVVVSFKWLDGATVLSTSSAHLTASQLQIRIIDLGVATVAVSIEHYFKQQECIYDDVFIHAVIIHSPHCHCGLWIRSNVCMWSICLQPLFSLTNFKEKSGEGVKRKPISHTRQISREVANCFLLNFTNTTECVNKCCSPALPNETQHYR